MYIFTTPLKIPYKDTYLNSYMTKAFTYKQAFKHPSERQTMIGMIWHNGIAVGKIQGYTRINSIRTARKTPRKFETSNAKHGKETKT